MGGGRRPHERNDPPQAPRQGTRSGAKRLGFRLGGVRRPLRRSVFLAAARGWLARFVRDRAGSGRAHPVRAGRDSGTAPEGRRRYAVSRNPDRDLRAAGLARNLDRRFARHGSAWRLLRPDDLDAGLSQYRAPAFGRENRTLSRGHHHRVLVRLHRRIVPTRRYSGAAAPFSCSRPDASGWCSSTRCFR